MRGDENTSVRVIDRELLISVRHRESSKGRKWTQRQKRKPKGGISTNGNSSQYPHGRKIDLCTHNFRINGISFYLL